MRGLLVLILIIFGTINLKTKRRGRHGDVRFSKCAQTLHPAPSANHIHGVEVYAATSRIVSDHNTDDKLFVLVQAETICQRFTAGEGCVARVAARYRVEADEFVLDF